MSVEIFKDGKSIIVEPSDLHDHLNQGYTLTNEPDLEPENENDGAGLEAARQLYFEKFGEKPHHKMKTETIMEKLNGNEPV